MEFYSAIENKIISFAEKCIELEVMMLSEMRQTGDDEYHISSHVQEGEGGCREVWTWAKKPICMCEDVTMKPIILHKFSKSGFSLGAQYETPAACRDLPGISGKMVTEKEPGRNIKNSEQTQEQQ